MLRSRVRGSAHRVDQTNADAGSIDRLSDGARALVGACPVKSLYVIPTWTRTARLIAEHAGLREALEGAPSEWACYRFSVKLRAHKPLLDLTLQEVAASLRAELPEYGRDVDIDASDTRAYANGQRFLHPPRIDRSGRLRVSCLCRPVRVSSFAGSTTCCWSRPDRCTEGVASKRPSKGLGRVPPATPSNFPVS
jgi:hypothetical protein